jgi:hypothetical protein
MPEPVLPDGGLCAGGTGGYQAAGETSGDHVPRIRTRHIVEVTKKGEKRIKEGFKSCQFLTEDRMCGVYEARPGGLPRLCVLEPGRRDGLRLRGVLAGRVGKLREREKNLKKSS